MSLSGDANTIAPKSLLNVKTMDISALRGLTDRDRANIEKDNLS